MNYLLIAFISVIAGLSGSTINEQGALIREIRKIWDSENAVLNDYFPRNDPAQQRIEGNFFTINHSDSLIGYAYLGRVYSCRFGGCTLTSEAEAINEYFDYLIIYNHAFSILKVKVVNYQATHGHGICSKGWLKQFIGYNGDEDLNVGKNIDALSGATVSTNSITFDIEKVTRFVKD